MSLIEFDRFGFRYEDAREWALREVSTTIEKGEILLVLGPSGCGKSTFALALNGVIPHLLKGEVDGTVSVSGFETGAHQVSELAERVGMVFQDPEIQLFALTVEDEVAMSLEAHGVPHEEMRRRVEWAMSICGIDGLELDAPAKLSGGQKQRVAIAAVLAREPQVLVFDEPTGNLDPVGSRSVYETVRRICDERDRTVILVEQDLAPVVDLVDRVLVLDEGHVVFEGEPRVVLREPELLHRCGVKVPVATEVALSMERRGLLTFSHAPASTDELMGLIDHRISLLDASRSSQDGAVTRRQQADDHKEVIRFTDVSHVYETGHTAIKDVDLNIYEGEFVAICGMNGAGKTTAVLHVMGLLQPTTGSVIVDGQDVRDSSVAEMARTVGLIFQNPNHQLFKDTVGNEVAFGPRNLGWDEEIVDAKVNEVLELVGLPGMRDRDPDSLSIGQKQRVAVASVLVMKPRIIILDEPTTGQDQRTLAPFMDLISQLSADGLTVLMITHDMDVAMRYATRMIVMSRAIVIGDDDPTMLFLQQNVLREAKLSPPSVLEVAVRLGAPGSHSVQDLVNRLDPSVEGGHT
jgi:energy-coupling factor transport system ATP-binding protein